VLGTAIWIEEFARIEKGCFASSCTTLSALISNLEVRALVFAAISATTLTFFNKREPCWPAVFEL